MKVVVIRSRCNRQKVKKIKKVKCRLSETLTDRMLRYVIELIKDPRNFD